MRHLSKRTGTIDIGPARRLSAGLRFSLALLVALLLAPSVEAQFCGTEDNLLFEIEVGRFLHEMGALADDAEALGMPAGEQLRKELLQVEELLAAADEEQLIALCELFREAPLTAALPELSIESLAAGSSLLAGVGLESEWTHSMGGDFCPALSQDVRNSLFVANVALQTVALVLQTTCEATQCVSLVCIITCGLAGVSNTAVLVTQAILDLDDYCVGSEVDATMEAFSETTTEQIDGAVMVLDSTFDPNLDVATSVVADQIAVDAVASRLDEGFTAADDDVGQLLTGIDRQIERSALFQEGSLRNRIERSLREGNDARVVSFQLPSSVGGFLEIVREITAEAIQTADAPPEPSLAYFREADGALNRERYKRAYTFYRTAYRLAVAPAPGDDS